MAGINEEERLGCPAGGGGATETDGQAELRGGHIGQADLNAGKPRQSGTDEERGQSTDHHWFI